MSALHLSLALFIMQWVDIYAQYQRSWYNLHVVSLVSWVDGLGWAQLMLYKFKSRGTQCVKKRKWLQIIINNFLTYNLCFVVKNLASHRAKILPILSMWHLVYWYILNCPMYYYQCSTFYLQTIYDESTNLYILNIFINLKKFKSWLIFVYILFCRFC